MEYSEVYAAYSELKDIVERKREAIIKKNLEDLNNLDEATLITVEKIKRFNLDTTPNSFSDKEKEDLKKLGEEIKKLEENNEILINHSLGVINNILSGILNIVQSDKNSYDAQGKGCINQESLKISSITEEA